MSDLLQHDEPELRAQEQRKRKARQGKARQKPMVMLLGFLVVWGVCVLLMAMNRGRR